MKSVAVILFLACACSGQIIGMNSWGLNGLAYNGLGLNGLGLTGLGLNGIGLNGLGVRTLGVNNLGLINGAPLAYNAAPIAMAAAPIAPVAPMVHASQYHSQDELGQASFGYSHPGQASSTYQDPAGNQIGSYAYINPEGREIRVSYVADALGFRVLSNDLPVAPMMVPAPVMDTPEVVEAKMAHMRAIADAKAGIVAVAPVMDLPQPVQDTPEVVAAKMEHAAAKAKALAESGSRKKRQAILPMPLNAGWMHGGLINGGLINAGLIRAAPVAAPMMTRDATLTQIVNNPGHAISYRVD